MTTVLVWVGVLLIGGIGSVKGALLAALLSERAMSGRLSTMAGRRFESS